MEGAKKPSFSSVVANAVDTSDTPLPQMNSGGMVMAIHYDGVLRMNGGIEYMGGKRKLKRINPSIRFEEFIAKMYTISECFSESTVLNFQYSICGKRCNDLDNEEDLNDMFGCIPPYCTEVWIFILKSHRRQNPPLESTIRTTTAPSVQCSPASPSRRSRSRSPCRNKTPSTEHKRQLNYKIVGLKRKKCEWTEVVSSADSAAFRRM